MEKDAVGQLFTSMGITLFFVQVAERAIGNAMKLVFPKDGIFSTESLLAGDEFARRSTLGGLLKELRRRVDIVEGFDATLVDFLNKRNEFIHHFLDKFSFDSPEGLADADKFCRFLAFQADCVTKTFSGAMENHFEGLGETFDRDKILAAFRKNSYGPFARKQRSPS